VKIQSRSVWYSISNPIFKFASSNCNVTDHRSSKLTPAPLASHEVPRSVPETVRGETSVVGSIATFLVR